MPGSAVIRGAQAIIFDMDGVIVDTEKIHVAAEKATCRYFGISVPVDEWNGFKGRTAIDVACHIVNTFSHGDISPVDFVARKTQVYMEIAQTELTQIPGAVDFIKQARGHFKQCALATSSIRVIKDLVFRKLDLEKYFDVTVTGDDVSRGKPDPEPYLLTAMRLELPPSFCVVVEDSDNGVASAKLAGCRVIGITTSYGADRLYGCGADFVVDDFAQLSGILDMCLRDVSEFPYPTTQTMT